MAARTEARGQEIAVGLKRKLEKVFDPKLITIETFHDQEAGLFTVRTFDTDTGQPVGIRHYDDTTLAWPLYRAARASLDRTISAMIEKLIAETV
jgi:hypothetical protein